MTYRLCIIGNSHVAAFASAWKTLRERRPDLAITFFAARGALLAELVVRGGALEAKDPVLRKTLRWVSDGRSSIVAADYDEFWLVGLRFGVETIMPVYAGFRADSHAADPSRSPVSDPAFAAAAAGLLRGSPAVDVYRKLRTITQSPVRLFPQPNPSIAALDARDARTAPFRLAARAGDATQLWRQYRDAREEIAVETGLTYRDQPDDTREGGIFTRAEHARGSVRLTPGLEREHQDRDTIHMNADFGALMLERYLPDAGGSAGESRDAGIAVEGAGRT